MNGRLYSTVEHAFQAAKSLDPKDRTRVRQALTPVEARRRGGKVAVRADWSSIRLAVMEDLVRQKFRDPELRRRLVATGSEELVDPSTPADPFWGRRGGAGENHLGQILMRIRADAAGEVQAAHN